jgi:hypothetical protein
VKAVARAEFEDEWTCDVPVAEARKRLNEFRMRVGMRPAGETGSTQSYKMGSHIATRLIGGWISKKGWLPTRASVTLEENGEATRVSAQIEEAFGVGVLDRKLKRKYEQQFAVWMEDLRTTLDTE